MSSSNNSWIWSHDHKRYYRIVYDPDPRYIWQEIAPTSAAAPVSQNTTSSASNIANATQRDLQHDWDSGTNDATQAASNTGTSTATHARSNTANYTQGNSQYVWDSGANTATHTSVNTTTSVAATAEYDTSTEGGPNLRPRADSGTAKKDIERGNHIRGTAGDQEELDPSYYVRTDGRRFFKKGRLFSVLFSEAMGETANLQDSECVTQVKYGGRVYTQIRRFVVVSERSGFCYACPVFTYGNRGTLKPGCRPAEHSIIYYHTLQSPITLLGENGMVNLPIGVEPEKTETRPMSTASRIRFGKVYPIDHNVKVKDLGKVIAEHMGRLITYYHNETLK